MLLREASAQADAAHSFTRERMQMDCRSGKRPSASAKRDFQWTALDELEGDAMTVAGTWRNVCPPRPS